MPETDHLLCEFHVHEPASGDDGNPQAQTVLCGGGWYHNIGGVRSLSALSPCCDTVVIRYVSKAVCLVLFRLQQDHDV